MAKKTKTALSIEGQSRLPIVWNKRQLDESTGDLETEAEYLARIHCYVIRCDSVECHVKGVVVHTGLTRIGFHLSKGQLPAIRAVASLCRKPVMDLPLIRDGLFDSLVVPLEVGKG